MALRAPAELSSIEVTASRATLLRLLLPLGKLARQSSLLARLADHHRSPLLGGFLRFPLAPLHHGEEVPVFAIDKLQFEQQNRQTESQNRAADVSHRARNRKTSQRQLEKLHADVETRRTRGSRARNPWDRSERTRCNASRSWAPRQGTWPEVRRWHLMPRASAPGSPGG